MVHAGAVSRLTSWLGACAPDGSRDLTYSVEIHYFHLTYWGAFFFFKRVIFEEKLVSGIWSSGKKGERYRSFSPGRTLVRGSYTTNPMKALVYISSHQRRPSPRSITDFVVQAVFTACRGQALPQHAWEATGRDGSDRWQLGVTEIVKGFPSLF